MWQKKYCLSYFYCWEHNSGKHIAIIYRSQYDVDLNNTTKTSRPTLEEAVKVAERYMKQFP